MTETFRSKKSGNFPMGRETENCLGQGLLLCFASVKRLKVTDQLSRQQSLKFGIAFSQSNALKTGILGQIHISVPKGFLV